MQKNTDQPMPQTSSSMQKKATNQRFVLTPQTVGMDSALLQRRQQQEQIAESEEVSPIVSQQSSKEVTELETSMQEVVTELETSMQSLASSSHSPNSKSVAELRSSSLTSNAAVIEPLCFERRSSVPSAPSIPFTKTVASLSNTAQNVVKLFSAQVSQIMSSPSTPTNAGECGHSNCDCASQSEIPIQHFEEQLQKFRSGSNFFSGGAAEINGVLNDVFLQRLKDIDANGQGDTDLKLVTYQEWVEMLLRINESILTNVEELETEVAKRLEYVQQRVSLNCRHSQGNELMQCRKDIDTLIKIIQKGFHCNQWNLHEMTFETVTPLQVYGLTNEELEKWDSTTGNSLDASESMQRSKLLAHVKALALEVAEKHDAVRDLKRQVICLEDDIQKAQQKIQFKDDVIKELRNDVKRTAKPVEDCVALAIMPPVNLDDKNARQPKNNSYHLSSNTYSAPLESALSENEYVEQQMLGQLSEGVDDLLTFNEAQRKQLMEKLKQAETEKAEAYYRLDFLRHQLTNLEKSDNQPVEVDAPGNGSRANFENDRDAKILENVRKRMRTLNQTICELRLKCQKSEREKSDLETKLISSEIITQRNEEALKDLADMLCEITGQAFSYTDIYKQGPKEKRANPFCDTIQAMRSVYQLREAHFFQTTKEKNMMIEELMGRIAQAEKIMNEQQKQRTNLSEGEDIDKITPPSSLLLQSQQATTLLPQATVQQTSKVDSLTDEKSHRQ